MNVLEASDKRSSNTYVNSMGNKFRDHCQINLKISKCLVTKKLGDQSNKEAQKLGAKKQTQY